MTVFISHDFDDRPHFENVTDALARESVEFWNPESVHAGESLADQLQAVIAECRLCIFIATPRSLASVWCATELGAFWGAGKKVLLFRAETTPANAEPPHLQGHYHESRLARLARTAKDYVGQSPEGVPVASLEITRTASTTAAPTSVKGIVEVLEAQLADARRDLARARDDLRRMEEQDPNASNTAIEGFEMAYSEHVTHLEEALRHLVATTQGFWTLR